MQQVDKDSYKQTIKVPLYGTDTSFGANVFGSSDSNILLNMMPVKVQDVATKQSEIQLHKRVGTTVSVDLSSKLTGTLANCEPLCHATTVMLGFTNIVAIYDDVAVHPVIRIIAYYGTFGSASTVLIGSISNANTTGGVEVTNADEVFITEIEHASGGYIVPAIAISWKKAGGSYSDGFYAISAAGVYTAASLTKITAASFPVTLGKIITGPFQQLNGIIYIMGIDGVIYGSGGSVGTINDITLWDANNTLRNRMAPDAGVGLFRYKHHLVAFNNSSIEFFNDVGNPVPASALANTEQAFIRFGAFSSKGIINVDDTLYWISNPGATQTIGMYKLEGYTPVKISTPSIDLVWTVPNSTQVGWLGVFITNGKVNLVIDRQYDYPRLTNPYYTYNPSGELAEDDSVLDTNVDTNQYSTMYYLCYNVSDGLWWRMGTAYNMARFLPCGFTSYSYASNFTFVMFGQKGDSIISGLTQQLKYKVYYMDQDFPDPGSYKDDDGAGGSSAFACIAQTRPVDFSTSNRKRVTKVDCLPVMRTIIASGTASAWLGVNVGPVIDVDGQGLYNPNFWVRHYITKANTDETANYYTPYANFANVFRWNNLGSHRAYQFAVYTFDKEGMILKDLDVSFNTMLS